MKRIPVTQASYKKISSPKTPKGVTDVNLKVGKPDKQKTRQASYLGYGGFGTMFGRTSMMGATSTFYNNSYMNGGTGGGFGDVPPFMTFLSQQNGGILYFPVTLKQKFEFYRFFYRCFVDYSLRVTLIDGTQKSLKDLQVGENVLNINGQSVQIDKKIQNEYNGIVCQLTCQGKKPLTVTQQHPFYVLQKGKIWHRRIDVKLEDGNKVRRTQIVIDYKPVWKKAGQLQVGDSFIIPNVFGEKEQQISIQLARLIGYFASQGSFIKNRYHENKGLRFSFHCDENVLIDQAEFLLKNFTANKVHRYTKHNCTTVYVNDAKLVQLFQKHINGVALTKKFSNQVMNLSVQKTKHLLAAYVNGDGHVTKENQIQVTTISNDLANQVYLLYAKCGYSPSRYQIKRKLPDKDANMIYIATHDSSDLSKYTNYKKNQYFCSSKHRKYNYNGNVLLPIRKITKKSYSGKVYNISTNGKEYQDRTFLIENIATHNCDAYVKAAVDLNTDLPMSRLQLRMPKMNDKKLSKRIQRFYETMIDQIHLFDKLHSILFETNILGNAVLFIEYDEKKKRWSKITILPPEEVSVANYPMSDIKRIQYRPQRLKSIIMKYDMALDTYEHYVEYVKSLPQEDQSILQDVSYEFIKQLSQSNGILTFDTDPYSGDGDDKIGSFAFHFTTKRHEYQDWGVSPLECLTIPLIQKTLYQYAQTSLATRNMSPRQVITAENITPQALQELRDQVDQAMLSPDYKIVTNYNISWQTIGADNRLIDLAREYETIENQLFAGLGVTRQLLTGQGMYSGNKISIEILNTKYLLVREMLQKFVEQNLFKPVALQNGFYHDDEDGNRTWFYPKLGFTRLTIRDNQETFDALFQLYQKGSLPIGIILDIFNINSDEVDEELKRDMFTVKDATYNEMLRQIYTDMGSKISQSTDLAKQIAESITGPMGRKLKYVGQDAEQEMDGQDYSTEGFGGQGFQDQQNDMMNEFNEKEKNFSLQSPMVEENNSVDQNVQNYIDSFKNNAGENSEQSSNEGTMDQDVKKYIDNLKNNGEQDNNSVKDYINGIINQGKDEQANVNQYINKFLKSDDNNAKSYINDFLGQNNSKQEDNLSDEKQEAGLFD